MMFALGLILGLLLGGSLGILTLALVRAGGDE